MGRGWSYIFILIYLYLLSYINNLFCMFHFRTMIFESACRMWNTYYENEGKCVYKNTERIHNQLHSVRIRPTVCRQSLSLVNSVCIRPTVCRQLLPLVHSVRFSHYWVSDRVVVNSCFISEGLIKTFDCH